MKIISNLETIRYLMVSYIQPYILVNVTIGIVDIGGIFKYFASKVSTTPLCFIIFEVYFVTYGNV